MIDRDEAETIVADKLPLGTTSGVRLGSVIRVFLDDYTGWPSFATVDLGKTDRQEVFVALHEAELVDRQVVVPYELDLILNAPRASPDRDLTSQEEDAVFDYYGVPIDGVSPSVAHLGRVLTPTDHGRGVTEIDTD